MTIPNQAWRGSKYPIGATWDGQGVNFSVYSEHASMVQLCIFKDSKEVQKINMRWNDDGFWHLYLPQARPGLEYGYRAHGKFEPLHGLYYNPSKLLLDPYAKQVSGQFRDNDALYGYRKDHTRKLTPELYQRDYEDSAPYTVKSVVADTYFNWKDQRPNTPLKNSIIYEMHVKGFSINNPKIDPKIRGTYAGLQDPASIEYLTKLNVTAVELLPVQLSLTEPRLLGLGLTNYWGYNTIGFFCPDMRYASTNNPISEFQSMVQALHNAGIEVILDVVYNHTAEQGFDGPTLSFRGLDNTNYYRLDPHDSSVYLNYSGCGNTVDTRNTAVIQLIADSLRYWVEVMHVDGFRFDLATTLARIGSSHSFRQQANFFDVIAQDPVLNKVKMIAEPWDCGPDGYQVGRFPKGWSEWNDKWRDTVRSYWRGQKGLQGTLASKLSGSSDLYWQRSPKASINFVTAHDGFTLNDLTSFQNKHNYANLEDNRDGSNDNNSWNCGKEGKTADKSINRLRLQQKKNMLATLLLSQGIPMILAGDEYGRTQHGNNNAYCQDNDISYLNWEYEPSEKELLAFTQQLIRIRRQHPVFRRENFFRGETENSNLKDILWLNVKGKELIGDEWNNIPNNYLGVYIAGDCLEDKDDHGNDIKDNSFLILLNSGNSDLNVTLPVIKNWCQWEVIFDTTYTTSDNLKDKSNRDKGITPNYIIRYSSLNISANSLILLKEIPRTGY